jgi:hypothetical protein
MAKRERSSFFEKFNQRFEDLLPEKRLYQNAFHTASNEFEQRYGIAPYSNWNSFKAQRTKHRKK